MDPQEKAFLRAIDESDELDYKTRLVYSDWLEERGRDNDAAAQRAKATPEWVEARRFLLEMSETVDLSVDQLIKAGCDYIDDENSGSFFPEGELDSDKASDFMWRSRDSAKKYWESWQVMTNRHHDSTFGSPFASDPDPFSCSC